MQAAFAEYRYSNDDSTFYFTDGSSHNNVVGSAATGPDFTFRTRLPDYSTVFSAEVYAIKRVLRHIIENHVLQSTICTDSKSALQALQRTEDFTHPGIFEVHQLIFDLSHDQVVTFLWLPGHCGIAGNEHADLLAKEGAMLPTPVTEPLALGDILHLSKARYAEHLQRQWDDAHANHLYRIKPKLKPWETCNQPSREREVILCRLRSGHTRLTHCHYFNSTGPPICESCDVRLSVEHLLISCTALRHERRHLLKYVTTHHLNLDLPTLLGDGDPALTDLVLDFVMESPFSKRL